MVSIDNVDAKAKEADALQEWKKQILDRDGGACVNCEKTSHVAPVFIVPPEVGGRLRASNGVTVCRECRIAAESSRVMPSKIDNRTPINFLVSKHLHDTVEKYANDSNLGTISAVIRSMIKSFISSPEAYEDLANWQDDGSDVKINGWVDGHQYEVFKQMCWERNISFTDAFKGLLMMAVSSKTNETGASK